MIEVSTAKQLTQSLEPFRKQAIGFVPTMGFLHQGHLSLITKAKHIAGRSDSSTGGPVVVSIFVNPSQFNDRSDFENYPSNIEQDRELLKSVGVDILYTPNASEIYPYGFSTTVKAGKLSQTLEGLFRPGHFDGVTTVVSILFNQVRPSFAVFGEKDFQQLSVIKQMVRDLSIPIEIYQGEIVREESGLAMSSRNSRLTNEGKQFASGIYRSLAQWTSALWDGTQKKAIESSLESLPGVNVQYVEVIEETTFKPATSSSTEVRILVAAFVEGVRLIDAVPWVSKRIS